MIDAPYLSPSEQNVVDNVHLLACVAASESSRQGLHIAEKFQSANMNDHGLQETEANDVDNVDPERRPAKRICSDPGKENTLETWEASKPFEKTLPLKPVGPPASRKASAASFPGISSVKGKSRVGLRRL